MKHVVTIAGGSETQMSEHNVLCATLFLKFVDSLSIFSEDPFIKSDLSLFGLVLIPEPPSQQLYSCRDG